jgi:hypothetical protein
MKKPAFEKHIDVVDGHMVERPDRSGGAQP